MRIAPREKHWNWKGGEVYKVCEVCGVTYHRRPVRAEKSRACSRLCHNRLMPTYRQVWNKGIGTKSSTNELVRKSKEYQEWRNSVFGRDDYTCQICRSRGGNLNADHIKPFAHFPELRFEITNGRTLCIDCHRKTPTYGWSLYHTTYAK